MDIIEEPSDRASAKERGRVPATEVVLEFILNEMDAGRLHPGSRINAARIGATLSLSAAPVREALSVLAGRGLIDLLPDRGAVMRPMSANEACNLWQVLAPICAVGVTLAARAVAAGADARELAARFDAIAANATNDQPLTLLRRLNDWHAAANRLGGNPFVGITMERLGVAYWDRFITSFIDIRAEATGYVANYRRMHEAVLAGDGHAAAAIMDYHANWSVALILKTQSAVKTGRSRSRNVKGIDQ